MAENTNNIKTIDVINFYEESESINLYEKIKYEVLSWNEEIDCNIIKADITFSFSGIFLRIYFPKGNNKITLEFPKGKKLNDPLKKTKSGKSTGGKSLEYNYSRWTLDSDDDIYYALSLIKQSYNFNKNKG